jgi:hypothetical protein
MRDTISSTIHTVPSTQRPSVAPVQERAPQERGYDKSKPKREQPQPKPEIRHDTQQLQRFRSIFQKRQTDDPELLLQQIAQHQPHMTQQNPHDSVNSPEPADEVKTAPIEIIDTQDQNETIIESPHVQQFLDLDGDQRAQEEIPKTAIETKADEVEELIEESDAPTEELLFVKEQLARSQERYHELALALVDAIAMMGGRYPEGKEQEEQNSLLLLLMQLIMLVMQALTNSEDSEDSFNLFGQSER